MNIRRIGVLLPALLIVGLVVAACGGGGATPTPVVVTKEVVVTPTPAGPPIKIGIPYGLSSIASVYTRGAVKGHNLAVAEINAAGGVLGRPFELVVRETNLRPDIAVQVVQQMVDGGVEFIVGTISSGVAQAISGFAKDNKIIFIDTIAQASGTTAEAGHRYVFRTTTNTVIVGRALAGVMAQRPETRYVTIGPDYSFGHDSVNDFLSKLRELKPEVQVVNQLWPSLLNPDYTTFINTILESEPEVVYASLWGGDLINFIRQAIPFGFFDKTTLVTHNMDLDILQALGKNLPDGIVATSGFPWYSLTTPEVTEFVDKYFDATGEFPVVGSILGYNSMYALKAAIEKAGTTETEAVVDALAGLTWSTPTGDTTIRALDHQANPTIWVGASAQSDDFPFPILTDLVPVPGSDVMLSEAEVLARRAQ